MKPEPNPDGPSSRSTFENLLRRALVLDLEVSHQGRILQAGAILGDRTYASGDRAGGAGLLAALAELANGASCVIGHNLVRHDLAILRERAPGHPLLALPVIDTLVLSPLAFPENPYHRLVKDHKLVRESVNDPVADARQAGVLAADEFRSFDGLRQVDPDFSGLLRFLLATPEGEGDALARGLDLWFDALGQPAPTPTEALAAARRLLGRLACASVPVDESLVQTRERRHALAYLLAWLRVAGSTSVLPPWVRLGHPLTVEWIRRWRDRPCDSPSCAYCRRVHDAREQLRSFFSLDDFRPVPANAAGGSLQRDIVEAGMRDESLFAILPTGGGKSLCYQLPALVRNFRRGALTIVISPLQALMKDQVDGLVRRTGTPMAAALYGLLTPPERGDVLRRVRLGDVAVLYVSPEQLRNRSFREAIAQREIGCWVFDEAHCLSKWGHDFRPDYLYAGRFIREFSAKQGGAIPPIACFTATAKQEVRDEILQFFRDETGRELRRFEGGVERNNLRFEVQMITSHGKLERVHDLLSERLPAPAPGSAIVFRATREGTVQTAEFLQAKGWRAAHFHAGLTPPEKKRIQDAFLAGEIQVICATNAFGMGIDKEDVRLVIHADTPGSLENYLQEAGRAGRDGRLATCILLHDEEDSEQQFRMGARSELSRHDIAQILRGLRRAARGGKEEIVITAGEILRDEEVETSIALQERSADTKVRTAISWLERAGFVRRDENVTEAFQARLLVRTVAAAEALMAPLNLPAEERALWLAILRELMNAGGAESLTVDRLALLPELAGFARRQGGGANPEFVSAKVLKTLGSMARAGLLRRDTLLNAFVRHKVADSSRQRLERILALDRKLVDVLAEAEPDPEGWMPLHLRALNQRLCDEVGPPPAADGPAEAEAAPAGRTTEGSSVEIVRALLRSLSEDGRGFAGAQGSLDLRHVARDCYRVRVRRSWTAIGELAEKRRRVAALVLDVLLAKIPAATPARAELLVEFSFEELHDAIERDPALRAEIRDIEAALERALMYLHEQRVIVLQQGLAVFRSAMRIRFVPEAKGERYTAGDYEPLQHHYQERVLQVHVMSEYARRGLGAMREALGLVLAYFSVGREEFIRRHLSTRPELLQRATTARSFQRIVTDLAHPAQIRIVTAPVGRNLLVLAGPGSGKTRTVVHRCAYLLRVERVGPERVLVCCFNRQAALEIRRRLRDLAGEDARGVAVLTYHALAMRLLGYSPLRTPMTRTGSPAALKERAEPDFNAWIVDAARRLRGDTLPPGMEPDEVRDRLLAGFQHILVDEYQDIDAPQYDLISAIAGRTLDDPDQKLSILAVGDDDQNIYSFRGANVEFIRRFTRDYGAETHYLVENYRSTRYVIEAANALMAANADRMKTSHPIRIDRNRELMPAGGEFGARDPVTGGRVQVLRVRGASGPTLAALGELRRWQSLGVDWSAMAVLAATHQELGRVRALAAREEIPVRWWPGRDTLPPLHQIREIDAVIDDLTGRRSVPGRASELVRRVEERFAGQGKNPWVAFLLRTFEAWRVESDDAEMPMQDALEFLLEACWDGRRDVRQGEGVTLSTVHGAKGTEHDHVLLTGAWALPGNRAAQEELRRLFYVGMTRARHSLTILEWAEAGITLPSSLDGPAILRRDFAPVAGAGSVPDVTWELLALEDVHLGYAGGFGPEHPIHAALDRLQPGDPLFARGEPGRGVDLCDATGTMVARLSRKAESTWSPRLGSIRSIRVAAIVRRRAEQDEESSRRGRYAVAEWEVPVVEFEVGEG